MKIHPFLKPSSLFKKDIVVTTLKQLNLFAKKSSPSQKKTEKKASSSTKDLLYIFFDGASRNNPGPSGAGIYIKNKNKAVCKDGYYLGKKTNNQAEYLAFLISLLIVEKKIASKKTNLHLVISSDSELLVKQINGLYKVKNADLKKIKKIIDTFLKNKSYEIKHVLRAKNKVADQLANEGIDSKKPLPSDFKKILENEGLAI